MIICGFKNIIIYIKSPRSGEIFWTLKILPASKSQKDHLSRPSLKSATWLIFESKKRSLKSATLGVRWRSPRKKSDLLKIYWLFLPLEMCICKRKIANETKMYLLLGYKNLVDVLVITIIVRNKKLKENNRKHVKPKKIRAYAAFLP